MLSAVSSGAPPRTETIQERLQRVIAVHFDPTDGAAFWLDRAAKLEIDPLRQVGQLEDLELFGQMQQSDLRQRPLVDYIPRRFHDRLERFVLGQTGGTTGGGVWTAYREDEFKEAFIAPFVAAANHLHFPRKQAWLYVGPGGPHIIGKVVRHLAAAMNSADPFSVDFDPRWAKRLPKDTFAAKRYLAHVLDQAMAVIDHEEIGVLFTTPAVLRHLAERMTVGQRARVRGVHYGGMAITADEMRCFQVESFPDAVHLSGYGNTLFGCCLELTTAVGRSPAYYPFGTRLHLEVVDEQGAPVAPGQPGRVRFTRLDESFLIIRLVERDQGTLVAVSDDAPAGFTLAGVENPQPIAPDNPVAAVGLY